jgi:hypothetical protein
MYIKCMKCACDDIRCTAKLKGQVKGLFKMRLDSELEVYLTCTNCGFKVRILNEAHGRTL